MPKSMYRMIKPKPARMEQNTKKNITKRQNARDRLDESEGDKRGKMKKKQDAQSRLNEAEGKKRGEKAPAKKKPKAKKAVAKKKPMADKKKPMAEKKPRRIMVGNEPILLVPRK